MPEVRPIALSESNWNEIAAALELRREMKPKAFEPIEDGYFTAALAAPPNEWQRIVIVVFPYSDPAWQHEATRVLRFEERSWQRWCELQECLTQKEAACPPLWWSRTEARRPAMKMVEITLDDSALTSIPTLVRPYIPYPTLRDSPLPPAKETEALENLQEVAEWVIGEESVDAFLERSGGDVDASRQRQPRWWERLMWWREFPLTVFVRPDLSSDDAREDVIRPHQLLSDGNRLIPTRWRPFHSEHGTFGRIP